MAVICAEVQSIVTIWDGCCCADVWKKFRRRRSSDEDFDDLKWKEDREAEIDADMLLIDFVRSQDATV